MADKTITTTPSIILEPDQSRQAVLFQNKSDTDIYIGNDNTVSISGDNSGILVRAGADIIITSEQLSVFNIQERWHAVCASPLKILNVNVL